MALFDFLSKNKTVRCTRCGASLKSSEAQQVNGQPYCSACHRRYLEDLWGEERKPERRPEPKPRDDCPAAIEQIRKTFDEMDVHYQVGHSGDQWEVSAGISGKSGTYQLKFICKDRNLGNVSLRIFGLTRFSEERKKEGCACLNRLQRKYRYLRLTLDKDCDVNVEYDLPDCTTNIGPIVRELLIRTMSIVDDVYPELMNFAWAGGNSGSSSGIKSGFRDEEDEYDPYDDEEDDFDFSFGSDTGSRKDPQAPGCSICGGRKTGSGTLCSDCLTAILEKVQTKDYLQGKISSTDLWKIDVSERPSFPMETVGCIYCGTRENLSGRICNSCRSAYLQQIIAKSISSKWDPQLIALRDELFAYLKSTFDGLKPEDVVIGPTPSGGAYMVKHRVSGNEVITEYDARHKEVKASHQNEKNKDAAPKTGSQAAVFTDGQQATTIIAPDTTGRTSRGPAQTNKIHTPEIAPEDKMSAQQLQQMQEVLNKTYPGLTMYVRDCNLLPSHAEKYQKGMVLCERAFVDATARVGGMATSHRFAILSNHMANLSALEKESNWQLHVANRNSHFKVLGTHTCQGKTAIFLLHLPNDDTWKLFQNMQTNLDEEVLADSIRRFEAKCAQPPIPELATAKWLDRCTFPVGMDDAGNFWSLE